MLVLIGASASGKTELAKKLISNHGFKKMITYTTRDKRLGEIDGLDYHFVSKDVFLAKEKENHFLETTTYNQNYYGTAFVDAQPFTVVIVDIPGANHIYKQLKDRVMIAYVETPEYLRKSRMLKRGDGIEKVAERLHIDKKHFNKSDLKHIDIIVQNESKTLEALADAVSTQYRKHLST